MEMYKEQGEWFRGLSRMSVLAIRSKCQSSDEPFRKDEERDRIMIVRYQAEAEGSDGRRMGDNGWYSPVNACV